MSNKIKIGKSEVVADSGLGLGTNKVGGHNLYQNLVEQDGYDLLKKSLDLGINFWDSAFAYGMGRSEEMIGEVLKDCDRTRVIVSTKAAQDKTKDMAINNSPSFLKKAVDDALLRLKTDYIDIFYIHFPDKDTPKNEAVAALAEARKEGKIRAIGVSNFSLEQIKEANKDGEVDIVENEFSLLRRKQAKEVMTYTRENGISFVPFFPLTSGLLTGKYQVSDWDKFSKTDNYNLLSDFSKEKFTKGMQALDVVRRIAEKHQATVTQVVLAWYMANPEISVVIPGARNVKQVESNAQTLNVSLNDKEYQEIDDSFSEF